jgi:predicted RNA-binding Zn-ribbon protein involved in translation (DUF1610 family)
MTKFYRSSESGTEELVLTPRATDEQIEAAAKAIQQVICPDDPFDTLSNAGQEEHRETARAALAAAQVAQIWKCDRCGWTGNQPDFASIQHPAGYGYQAPHCPNCGRYFGEMPLAAAQATAPAPWPTEEQIAQEILSCVEQRSVSYIANAIRPISLDIARDVGALYRNALRSKVKT